MQALTGSSDKPAAAPQQTAVSTKTDKRLFASSGQPARFVMADGKARPDRRDGAWLDAGPAKASGATVTKTDGYWVQIAARKERRLSERAWSDLVAQHGKLLGAEAHVIRRANFDDGRVFYRLQIGPYPTKRGADSKCIQLQSARIGCFLVAADGRILLASRPRKARRTSLTAAQKADLRKFKAKARAAGRSEAKRATRSKPAPEPMFLKSTRIPGMPE